MANFFDECVNKCVKSFEDVFDKKTVSSLLLTNQVPESTEVVLHDEFKGLEIIKDSPNASTSNSYLPNGSSGYVGGDSGSRGNVYIGSVNVYINAVPATPAVQAVTNACPHCHKQHDHVAFNNCRFRVRGPCPHCPMKNSNHEPYRCRKLLAKKAASKREVSPQVASPQVASPQVVSKKVAFKKVDHNQVVYEQSAPQGASKKVAHKKAPKTHAVVKVVQVEDKPVGTMWKLLGY